MKKTIGLYADVASGRVGQTAAYMQYLSQFGFIRMITPLDNLEEVAKSIDMLVLPGGSDVDSIKYDSPPGIMDGRVNQHYEYLDAKLLPLVIAQKKPILGICRGMQALNIHFGGTMHQHVIGHHQGENRVATKQEIQFEKGGKPYFVNSMHHQSLDKLGDGFEMLAYSMCFKGCYSDKNLVRNWSYTDDKNKTSFKETYVIVEMIKHSNLPILGVQWHPEEFNCQITSEWIINILK